MKFLFFYFNLIPTKNYEKTVDLNEVIAKNKTEIALLERRIELLLITQKEQAEIIQNLKKQLNIQRDESIKKMAQKMEEFQEQLEHQKKELQAKYDKEIKKFQENPSNLQTTLFPNENHKDFKILDANNIHDFEKIEKIGSGYTSKVYKVASKPYYVLKVMKIKNLNIENLQNFIKEYEIMNSLDHPFIMKSFGIFLSDESTPPSILLEYCPIRLDLAIKNKTMTNDQICCIIFQIAEGMKYVHFRKIIHRDLKPSNIMISADGTIKIGDFGISKLMTTEEQSMTFGVGTQKFMAPEIINEEDDYNEKVDVYSFGVLVFFILNNGEMPKIKVGEILRGKKAEIPETFTELSKQIISSCWNFNPDERPSFNTICETLDKFQYSLLQLTESENQSLQASIRVQKAKIPFYSS